MIFCFFRNSIHYIENIWINPNPGTFFAAAFANMFKEFTIRRKEKFIWSFVTFYFWSFQIIPSSAEFNGKTHER